MNQTSNAGHASEQCGVSSVRAWLFASAVLVLFIGFIWASDRITLKGQRTVYTVECDHGTWNGSHCSGKLKPGARHRFSALKARGEVVFWVAGASEPPGRLTGCTIDDGRDWVCPPGTDASRTITLHMSNGRPVPNPNGPSLPLHSVEKWRWWLLRCGIPPGNDREG